jgi:hypothetical protein
MRISGKLTRPKPGGMFSRELPVSLDKTSENSQLRHRFQVCEISLCTTQCSQSTSRRSSSQRSENSATSYSSTLSTIECGRSVTIFAVPYPSGIPPQRSSPLIPLSRRGLSGCQVSLRTRNGATARVIAWIFCIGRRTARSPKQRDLSILPCYTSMLPELSSSPRSAKFVLWRPR